MKRPIGQCSLCLKEGKELQSSHAIPNAIFKPILAMNNGAGIAIHQDMKVATHYSGDSWKEHRLCRDCEYKLNNAYENKAIRLIRREKGLAHYCEDGLSISRTDLGRLRSFFVSVFWRASVWSHEAFKHFHLPHSISEDIRKQLLTGGVVSSQLIGVRLLTLRDATFGYPEAEPFQQMICNPFHRKTPSGMILVCCFGGFLIEAKLGGYRGKERENSGVLNNDVRPMIAPWCNFFRCS